MSLFPHSNKERVLYAVIVLLVVAVIVLAMTRRAQSVEDPREALSLDVCVLDLESAERMRDHYKDERDTEREVFSETLKNREALWREIYERTKNWAAGEIECKADDCANEYCWERIARLEEQLEGEKKMYRWNLKFGDHIKDKDDRSVRKYESKVKAYAKEHPDEAAKYAAEIGLTLKEVEGVMDDD